MIHRYSKIVLVLGLLLLLTSSARGRMDEWQIVHGNIIGVFAEQQKIMLDLGINKQIYRLEDSCQILRLGAPTSLDSLRPITHNAFQDALCWINNQGHIEYLLVNYSVYEQSDALITYDIFGNSQ